jgi:RepB DNA-primase from phage plasmid
MPKPNPNKRQLQRYCNCVFDENDIVEVRLLPSGHRSWHKAKDLPDQFARLNRLNGEGQNVYLGANPRTAEGQSSAEGVAFAHCLFADFDGGATVEHASEKISAAGMPEPTALIESGHGCHAYWRFESDDEINLEEWPQLQRALIAAVDSDSSVHDLPRVMRVPGFLNLKSEPFVPCTLVDADASRKYGLQMLRAILAAHLKKDESQPQPEPAPFDGSQPESNSDYLDKLGRASLYVAKIPNCEQGERNPVAFKVAAAVVNDFALDEADAWRLLSTWNLRNEPPLDESELRQVFENAANSAQKPKGCKAETKAEPRYKIRHGGGKKTESKPEGRKKEPSQAEILIDLAGDAELWRTPDGDPFASVKETAGPDF